MKATRVWGQITGRPVSPRVSEWIERLVEERGGDDRVAATITRLGATTAPDRLLGAVSDALAREDASRRPTPRELTRAELLAWVRGSWEPPAFPVIYDLPRLGLSAAEIREVEAWAVGRHGMRPLPRPAPEPLEDGDGAPADAPAAGGDTWFEPEESEHG